MTKNKNIENVKDTMKLGIGSMAGMGAVGAMSGMPGMPQNTPIPGMVGASLAVANIGQMAKNAHTITNMMGSKQSKKHKK